MARSKKMLLTNRLLRNLWLLYSCIDYYVKCLKCFREVRSEVVVVDRYIDDFIIDQALNFGVIPRDLGAFKNILYLKRFRFPDYKIILELPAGIGYRRKKDGTPFVYIKAREEYYKQLDGLNTLCPDGRCSIQTLSKQIETWVLDKLDMKKYESTSNYYIRCRRHGL